MNTLTTTFALLATISTVISSDQKPFQGIPPRILVALNNIQSIEEFYRQDFIHMTSPEETETGSENPDDTPPTTTVRGIEEIPSPNGRNRHRGRNGARCRGSKGCGRGQRVGSRRNSAQNGARRRDGGEPESHLISSIFTAPALKEGMAPSSSCTPKNQSILAPIPPQPNEIYYPFCITIPRCGGCCLQSQTCLPQLTITRTYKLTRRAYSEISGGLEPVAEEDIDFIEHKSCRCECKVKEEDCNRRLHEYIQNDCRCKCRNEEEKDRCAAFGKVWNDDICSCECLHKANPPQCNRTQHFSEETCRCETSQHQHLPIPGNTCAAQSVIDLCMAKECSEQSQPELIQRMGAPSRCSCRRRRRRNRRIH